MGAKLGTSGGPMAEMNVTPLIDVVLVLLVVFMVITPLLQSGLAVDLPIATTTETVNDVGQHIVVSVTIDGRWAVEQDTVTRETIIEAINTKYRENPERSVLVKADGNLPYEDVREVMDILAENNMLSVLIAAAKEQ
ncbi:MAG: biopolymer transporter ExbD [Deltaproteobacteria bacterium]|nr:biopolymer transporter ExbD [Deltaproteobacteria bacterium]